MAREKSIHVRVDNDFADFWSGLEGGHRSAEARRMFKHWMSVHGEDSREKWKRIRDEHLPYVTLADRKLAEFDEGDRQAIANQDAQQQMKENNLKTLIEAFGHYDFRVGDVPPSTIKHYAELLKLSSEEIKKLLTAESKKRGMI